MNASSNAMTAWQFTAFRIIFGAYLAIHFTGLVPYATELFGSTGLIGDPSLNPAAGLFPNPLNLGLPPASLAAILISLVALSLCYAAGFLRPLVSIVLWFGWTALFHRNNLISNPSIPYVGLLLALSAIVPGGEPLSTGRIRDDWKMPAWIPRCAWFLLAAGYTFSGYTKLHSPSWTDGSAMRFLLENPLARPGFIRDSMLALPDGFLASATWFTLAAELLYLPLACFRKTRPWIWLVMVLLHIGIILVVDFADLSLGMLMIHAFTFDHRWLPGKFSRIIVAYDGDCATCSRSIRFLAGQDDRDIIRFTTLQSDRGKQMEATSGSGHLTGLVIEADGAILTKFPAVIALLESLGGMWRIAACCASWLPKSAGGFAYDRFAANRYRWFGKNLSCGLPDAGIRSKLL
ncbi:DUF393 domain-containing protein [Akkermansiaceae bacterium]|nr:DUF393 domain-containing protein [Akkermansiaceae bacterium]